MENEIVIKLHIDDSDNIDKIRQEIQEDISKKSSVNKINASSSELEALVVLLDYTIEALPHILTFILGYLTNTKVISISFDGVDIKNPTKEIISIVVENLRKKLENDSDEE